MASPDTPISNTPVASIRIYRPTRRWPIAAEATALQSCKTSIWMISPPRSGNSATGRRSSSARPGCGSGAMPAAAAAWTAPSRRPSSCPGRQMASGHRHEPRLLAASGALAPSWLQRRRNQPLKKALGVVHERARERRWSCRSTRRLRRRLQGWSPHRRWQRHLKLSRGPCLRHACVLQHCHCCSSSERPRCWPPAGPSRRVPCGLRGQVAPSLTPWTGQHQRKPLLGLVNLMHPGAKALLCLQLLRQQLCRMQQHCRTGPSCCCVRRTASGSKPLTPQQVRALRQRLQLGYQMLLGQKCIRQQGCC